MTADILLFSTLLDSTRPHSTLTPSFLPNTRTHQQSFFSNDFSRRTFEHISLVVKHGLSGWATALWSSASQSPFFKRDDYPLARISGDQRSRTSQSILFATTYLNPSSCAERASPSQWPQAPLPGEAGRSRTMSQARQHQRSSSDYL